jgi:NADH:ubiquinone oxidoreductase subunit B-like Fe-S oxidoreductase
MCSFVLASRCALLSLPFSQALIWQYQQIAAQGRAFYDLERFGLRLIASPRHADVLLVTGPVTRNMRQALERTYQATPDPKWVVAGGIARPTAAYSPAATRSRAESIPSFPSIFI